MAGRRGSAAPAGRITLGATVYLDGVAWGVWAPAPARGTWWLSRYDDDGKHQTIEAKGSELVLAIHHEAAKAKGHIGKHAPGVKQ